MTLQGHVARDGRVVLEVQGALRPGTKVSVRALNKPRRPKARKRPPTLLERFAAVVGKSKSLPPDAVANHDHYLYGVPKRRS